MSRVKYIDKRRAPMPLMYHYYILMQKHLVPVQNWERFASKVIANMYLIFDRR